MENKNLKTKILYVVTRPPYPALDGTRERILGELKKLNEDFDVSLLIVTDEKVAEKTVQHLQSILTGEVVVFNLLKIKCYLRSFVGLFSSLPLQCSYFYSQKVKKWLQMNEYKYKVIHFHTIRLGEYIKDLKKNRISSKASRLLLCFNDAISLNYSNAKKTAIGLWRIIYKIESNRIKDYELEMLKTADSCSIISRIDKEFIENNWKEKNKEEKVPTIITINHSIDDSIFDHTYNPETQNLVFLGNLLYPPNLQGMELFCKNIFPLIFKNKTETKLFIIGRGGKEHFSGLRNVEPLGFVDNPYDFISKQALFINPATFGAGVPSKVLLAMAIGIPVVSTNNNISGIEDIQDKENVCLIDHNTPEKSAEKILALLSDEKNRKQIGNAGKVLALNNHKLSRNYAKLKNFIQNK